MSESDFMQLQKKWSQARYNRRAYESLLKMLKNGIYSGNAEARNFQNFVSDLSVAVQNGFYPDYTPSLHRTTLLSYAAANCTFANNVIRALLNHGANPNLNNSDGSPVLHSFLHGYFYIIFDEYKIRGINKDECGRTFSEILRLTDDLDIQAHDGTTAMSILCDKYLWSKSRGSINKQGEEIVMSLIFDLLDAGASFEKYLARKTMSSEALECLKQKVKEYQDYKAMTSCVMEQDIEMFLR